LKYRPFAPRELRLTAKSRNLFEDLRRHDILLHHPYDSYDAVVSFMNRRRKMSTCSRSKQTLYRTNEHSLICLRCRRGTAEGSDRVVELKARFDEAHNIRWARDLEDAGVQVFHGLVG